MYEEEIYNEMKEMLVQNINKHDQYDLASLKDHFKYFFEACIWGTLVKIEVRPKSIEGYYFWGAPPSIQDYWIKLFRIPDSKSNLTFYEHAYNQAHKEIGALTEKKRNSPTFITSLDRDILKRKENTI